MRKPSMERRRKALAAATGADPSSVVLYTTGCDDLSRGDNSPWRNEHGFSHGEIRSERFRANYCEEMSSKRRVKWLNDMDAKR